MKNNKKRICLIAILVVLLIVLLIGFTYSKYAERIGTGATGKIAKWEFSGEVESSTTNMISLSDTLDENSEIDKIAPGTSGSFNIIADAEGSDVDIDYIIKWVSESNKPQNLYFYMR